MTPPDHRVLGSVTVPRVERRSCRLGRLAGAAALMVLAWAVLAGAAAAQSWPQHPVNLIIPYPPGGNVDTQARVLADKLTAKLGQPFIVQNRAGATGAIATSAVAHADPDGYTLLFASSAQISSVPRLESVNYKVEDLIPVSAFGSSPMILAVNAKTPAHTLKEFMDYVRASPGKYSYASAGSGSIGHLVSALFLARGKLNMLHVPYKGGAPAVTDLMGGQVEMYFGNAAELLPYARSDRLRLIAVSAAQRMKQLPDVAAASELLPGFEVTAWNGLLVPLRTPQPIIDVLEKEVQVAAKDPAVIDKLATFGIQATGTTSAQFVDMIKKEAGLYEEAIAAAGLTKNQ